MRLAACSLLFLMACGGGGNGDDYPIQPGGGDGTGNDGSGDGVTDGGVDGATADRVTGKVCVLTDSTTFDGCKATGLTGIRVAIAGATVTTNDLGEFSIAKPPASATFWNVQAPTAPTGIRIVNSIVPYSSDTLLRTMLTSDYTAIVNANAAVQPDGAAAVFVQVTDNDAAAVAGAIVSAPVTSTAEPVRYGDANDTWSTNAPTRDRGVAWLTNVIPASGKIDIKVTMGAVELPPQSVKVSANYVTFASISSVAP